MKKAYTFRNDSRNMEKEREAKKNQPFFHLYLQLIQRKKNSFVLFHPQCLEQRSVPYIQMGYLISSRPNLFCIFRCSLHHMDASLKNMFSLDRQFFLFCRRHVEEKNVEKNDEMNVQEQHTQKIPSQMRKSRRVASATVAASAQCTLTYCCRHCFFSCFLSLFSSVVLVLLCAPKVLGNMLISFFHGQFFSLFFVPAYIFLVVPICSFYILLLI